MIRTVLDTNVPLAALRSRQGAAFEIISRYRMREFALLISNLVLSEYDGVLKLLENCFAARKLLLKGPGRVGPALSGDGV